MFILAFLLLVWSAIAWFSGPFAAPPFGIDILHYAPGALLLCSGVSLLGGIVLRLIRNGNELIRNFKPWWRRQRTTVLLLCGIIAFHLVLETPYIVMVQGANDADSGLYGLAGYRIADGSMRPMFNASKHHNGSLVPHLTAVLNITLGKSPIWLRVVNVAFYSGFILLMFFLSRLLFDDRRVALIAAFLAALPGMELFWALKYPEASGILFWGALSLIMLIRLIRAEKPGWRAYFWLGVSLGVGLWIHYQMMFFLAVAFIALLIRDWLFFRRPVAWLIPLGMLLGGMPLLLDISYYGMNILRMIVTGNFRSMELVTRIPSGVGFYLAGFPQFLGVGSGSATIFYGKDLFGAGLTWIVLALFVLLLVRFSLDARAGKAAGTARLNGQLLILIFLFCILALLALSRYAYEAPMRYILPAWIGVIIVVAAGSVRCASINRHLPAALTAVFASVLFFSGALQTILTDYREQAHRQFVETLDGRGIHSFYGSWLRTHWTQFVTGERIAASSNIPFSWHPFLGDYYRVRNAPGNPAILFDYGQEPDAALFLKNILEPVGVSAHVEHTTMGPLIWGMSERFTVRQMPGILPGKYLAEIGEISAGAGPEDCLSFTVPVINRGSVPWMANARSGHLELVIRRADGTIRRRMALARDIAPGESIPWQVLLSRAELDQGPLLAVVTLNDFIITPGKRRMPLPATAADGSTIPTVTRMRLENEDQCWANGWGIVQGNGRSLVRWSGGSRAQMLFVAPAGMDATLQMTLRPFRWRTLPVRDQIISLWLNGEKLPGMIILRGRKRCSLTIPAELLRAGLNSLEFSPSYIEQEFQPSHNDPQLRLRPRAFAVEDMMMELSRP